MAKRRPNNGNSLSVVSTRKFYASQKAETENITLNCDRPFSTEDYKYFTTLFDFTNYRKEDIGKWQSLYFDSLKNKANKNKRKELEIICRVLLTQINAN